MIIIKNDERIPDCVAAILDGKHLYCVESLEDAVNLPEHLRASFNAFVNRPVTVQSGDEQI